MIRCLFYGLSIASAALLVECGGMQSPIAAPGARSSAGGTFRKSSHLSLYRRSPVVRRSGEHHANSRLLRSVQLQGYQSTTGSAPLAAAVSPPCSRSVPENAYASMSGAPARAMEVGAISAALTAVAIPAIDSAD